jgi:DNA-directed RNA polymerase specialized sigma24 family protein
MKIKYIFADGTVSEVEVDEEYGRLHLEAERKIENDNRRWRYHVKASLDNCDYEGEWFQDMNPNPHEQMLIDSEYEESEKEVQAFKKTLTHIQLARLEMLEEGMTQREIAEREGVNLSAVQKSIDQIRKKHKTFFDK